MFIFLLSKHRVILPIGSYLVIARHPLVFITENRGFLMLIRGNGQAR